MPTFLKHILAYTLIILGITLCTGLGFWQLDRMAIKQNIYTAFSQAESSQPALVRSLKSTAATDPFIPYQSIQIAGILAEKESIFINNQRMDGQIGYHVITPLYFASDEPPLLINRGFIAGKADTGPLNDQADLQDLSVSLAGFLIEPPPTGFLLGDNLTHLPGQFIYLQRLDIALLSQATGQTYQTHVLLLNKNSTHGFARNWQIIAMPPEKHLGYAVQWFALALTLAILSIIMYIRTHRNEQSTE